MLFLQRNAFYLQASNARLRYYTGGLIAREEEKDRFEGNRKGKKRGDPLGHVTPLKSFIR